LPPRKFPPARERLALRPLGKQYAPVGVDERSGDDKGQFDASHVFPLGEKNEKTRFVKDSLTLLGREFHKRNKSKLIPDL
jgi:hypothetical protein